MVDGTARMIGSVGIWLSMAVVLGFGVCRMNFDSPPTFILALMIVCGSAVVATWIVWRGHRPDMSPPGFPVVPTNAD